MKDHVYIRSFTKIIYTHFIKTIDKIVLDKPFNIVHMYFTGYEFVNGKIKEYNGFAGLFLDEGVSYLVYNQKYYRTRDDFKQLECMINYKNTIKSIEAL